MKKLWFALVLVAVLCLGCWARAELYCSQCDQPMNIVDEGNTCEIKCSNCGAIEEVHQDPQWVDGGEYVCKQVCMKCGKDLDSTMAHVMLCDTNGKCYYCKTDLTKYRPSSYNFLHSFDAKVEAKYYSQTHHEIGCSACNKGELEKHTGFCADEAMRCFTCGVEGVVIEEKQIMHAFDAKGICNRCGKSANATHVIPGDADNNSSVTLADVRAILSGNVGSEANADVTGDGKADQQDALRIMQYISGWAVTLK